MKIIGVTGTSGSGKTTLSEILNEREDVVVFDADKIAKEMSSLGTDYLKAIRNTFGEEVFLKDGNLNRKALADKIYSEDASRQKLNNLTFKFVVDEILNRIKNINDSKIKFVIIDAPLLFESGIQKYCDFVISLIADENLKIERICKRDNIDRKTAKSRLNIQNEDKFYIEKSDFVIYNTKNCDLRLKIEEIINKISN